MKKQLIVAALCLLAGFNSRAAIFRPGLEIPDGNLAGVTFSGMVTEFADGLTVGGLTVHLDITGGIDGNLLAYLIAPNGTTAQLLSRPGVTGGNPFGNLTSGLNLTLANGGNTIDANSSLNSGLTYAAAGKFGRVKRIIGQRNMAIIFAEAVTGGGTATLNSWSLNITAVPEPVNVALAMLGVGFGGASLFQWWRRAAANKVVTRLN